MKPAYSLLPSWRTWISGINLVQRHPWRSPLFATSRQLSLLAARSRTQLRNRIVSAPLAGNRWNTSTTVPVEKPEEVIAGKIGVLPSKASPGQHSPTAPDSETSRADEPAYEISFTCKPCQTRSTHRISKQGYHKGTILITCPDCKNRHLICDHLKIFRDESTTIEDILREKGELIKRGALGTEGDIEMWDDGTTTKD